LRPGQLLVPTSANMVVPEGGVWQVVGCDDQGITLSPEGASPFDPTVRWADPDWKAHWTKVPKRRAASARTPQARSPKARTPQAPNTNKGSE
jgi:hypothetical protein